MSKEFNTKESISFSIVTQLLSKSERIGIYKPHNQLLNLYVRRRNTRTQITNENIENKAQKKLLFNIQVLSYKNCISCHLVTPILHYLQDIGYIDQIEVKEFTDKRLYLKSITKIAKKHKEPNSYPLVLVQYLDQEVMIPSHILNDILTQMKLEIDELTFYKIITGASTGRELEYTLKNLSSQFILGVIETMNIISAHNRIRQNLGDPMTKKAQLIGIIVILSLAIISTATMSLAQTETPLYVSSNYTFTKNINQPIIITADNIVINGSIYELEGTGDGDAITVIGLNNVTIIDVAIKGWETGIRIESTTNSSIDRCSILRTTQYGIWVGGDTSNISVTDNILTTNVNGIGLQTAYTVFISDNTIIDNTKYGIELDRVSNAIVSKNLIIDNGLSGGIFTEVTKTTIDDNTISDNKYAIWLDRSSNNTISNNFVTDNGIQEIHVGIAVNKQITGGAVTLVASRNNNISLNIIDDNGYGIKINESQDNVIYRNSFIENGYQIANETQSVNYWYHPEKLEGNYWSDYQGEDDGSGSGKHAIAEDGIGDTTLPWPEPGYDEYPLMGYPSKNGSIIITSQNDFLEGFDRVNVVTPVQILLGFGIGSGLILLLWVFKRSRNRVNESTNF